MMRRPLAGQLWVLAVYACACSMALAVTPPHRELIIVSRHALDAAVVELEKTLHCVITFEDAPYDQDLRVERLFDSGPNVPRERRLVFDYDPTADPLTIIQSLLATYRQIDRTVVFTVVREARHRTRYQIFPVKVWGKDLQMIAYESPVWRQPTFKMERIDMLGETLERWCQEVSTTNEEIVLPHGNYANATTAETPTFTVRRDQSCLDQIVQFYGEIPGGPNVSWSLWREPKINGRKEVAVLKLRVPLPERDLKKNVYLSVESARPLFTALRILDHRWSGHLLYEDIQYHCPCDTLSNQTGQPQIPVGGKLEFSFATGTPCSTVIRECVKAYNEQGNTGGYAVGSDAHSNLVWVTPARTKDKNGILRTTTPLLAEPISFSSAKKTAAGVLGDLCSAISIQTHQLVRTGNVPKSIIYCGSMDTTPRPIQQILSEFITRPNRINSFYFLYLPKQETFTLSVDFR